MLDPCRVLDLTDEKGLFCGKILADLGAEVIKIEPPEGDSARRLGPFFHNEPNPDKSLYWFAFNTGKKGITLDLSTSDGQTMFKRMVVSSDIVIESFQPGYLESLGLSYRECSRLNPRIIMTSITPQGPGGPYKDFKTGDLEAQAMSGTLYITGLSEKAPISWNGLQAYNQSGVQAAIGTLMALYYLKRTGSGQHVDVSIRESMLVLSAVEAPVVHWVEAGVIRERKGDSQVIAGLVHRWFYRCKDGYVIWLIQMGVLGKGTNALMQWMEEEGQAAELKKEVNDWTSFGLDSVTQEQLSHWEQMFANYFLNKTKKELFEGILKRGIMLCPVSDMAELAANQQLLGRNYWVGLDHEELGSVINYPGAYFKASETIVGPSSRAPHIGEHNLLIYGQMLGLESDQLQSLKENGVI